jgi:isoquinoline 1-oxidoreductase beta subunit
MNNPEFSVSRRSFIKDTAVAGGGLLLGFSSVNAAASTPGLNEALSFNPFILISPDGSITIYSPNPEVGQGVKTAMPMIVAEELDADWSKVKVEQAPLDGKKYQRQVAGGSGSLKASWATLRQAGATVRMMMLSAAAQKWQVSVDSLRTENSQVLGNNQKASYAELAAEAVKQAVPTKVLLKKPSEFRLLGKSIANVDNKDIFTGKAIYGIDIKKPGMKYAVVARPPGFGQIPDKINDAAAKAIPGVFGVYPFDDKIAIVANDTWTALKARKALDVSWIQKTAAENTTQHDKWLTDLLTQKPAKAFRADGDAETAFSQADKIIEASFSCPFLPHNAMEPMNFFADVKEGSAELIGPSQTPQRSQTKVAEILGLPVEAVTVQMTRMGGGFGRRLSSDFAEEAAKISRLAKSPVKVQWTREDDMAGGVYRPACKYTYRAAIDKNGEFLGFHVRGAGLNVGNPTRENNFPAGAIQHLLIEGHNKESNVTTGPWRAPVHNFVAFAEQCFLDEVAFDLKKDPIDFRMNLLDKAASNPVGKLDYDVNRFKKTIQLVRSVSGWDKKKEGVFMGFSAYFSFSSYVAMIAEVVMENNKPVIKKVYCAADCGIIVNRSGAENQIVGGIIDGLGHAQFGNIDIKDGKSQQSNFDSYRMIKINESFPVEVHFVENEIDPTGLGEPALPPAAAAVANAFFAATGNRLYNQPFTEAKKNLG